MHFRLLGNPFFWCKFLLWLKKLWSLFLRKNGENEGFGVQVIWRSGGDFDYDENFWFLSWLVVVVDVNLCMYESM